MSTNYQGPLHILVYFHPALSSKWKKVVICGDIQFKFAIYLDGDPVCQINNYKRQKTSIREAHSKHLTHISGVVISLMNLEELHDPIL